MLFFYRINGSIAVGAPRWRLFVSRAPAGILLRSNRTFPPNHPTTRMCLRLMLRDLDKRRCRSLIDVGCGSGILALAGLKLGVERALALDPSPRALATSRANAQLNGLERCLFLVRGSTESVAGCFDMVVANLPLPVLVKTLPDLVRLTGRKGSLVLSGFQDLDKPLLEMEMAQQQLVSEHWLSADLTFFDAPPTESFTWMAVLAFKNIERDLAINTRAVNGYRIS